MKKNYLFWQPYFMGKFEKDDDVVVIEFKASHPDAVQPEIQTVGSSGADVRSVDRVDLAPGEFKKIDLGFSMSIPEGYEIQVRPRSGLAAKHGVTVLNTPGTIDSDYRGPMCVVLINHGPKTFSVNPGDRIAQIVLAKVSQAHYEEVADLKVTNRGTGGFGSTGRN
jgi:dUTP pyrophosphatase